MDQIVVLAALAVAAVAGLGLAAVRSVPEGRAAVVVRAGRAKRVVGAGPVVVVPGLDRVHVVELHPPPLEPVSTVATTADGAEVRLVVSVLWEVTDPQRTLTAFPDPGTVIAEAVERALRHLVAETSLVDLLQQRHQDVSSLPPVLLPVLAPTGVRVVDVDLLDLDVRVGAELLRLIG